SGRPCSGSCERYSDGTSASQVGRVIKEINPIRRGLRGGLWVTFEEGTSAAWLYGLLKPHVAKVVVCNPRRNALLKAGNKNDRVDARKLSDLLRAGLLTPVYHGESGVRTLRELS